MTSGLPSGSCSATRLRCSIGRAGALAPGTPLRSLDAIHIAAASALGAALSYFVTYDKRLLAAAEAHGLRVATPA